MQEPSTPEARPRRLGAWALIAAIMLAMVAAFGYVGGWLAPQRLTPEKLIDQFQRNAGTFAGYRRNHAKGLCVEGTFESNGNGARVSRAAVFAPGTTPVIGRFAIPGSNPSAPDASTPVRSTTCPSPTAHAGAVLKADRPAATTAQVRPTPAQRRCVLFTLVLLRIGVRSR